MQRSLVIMLKEPRPGRVKTRLGRDIGLTAAAWWFRHQSARLIRRLSRDPRWHITAAVSPDTAVASRAWPLHLHRMAQGSGDLGDRMARIFRSLPPGPALIIGADIPGITPAHINAGFEALGRHDAVIGPAPDGGYWLIGLRRGGRPVPAHIFKAVRWSSEHAMADTIRSLGADLSVAKIATLRDVDRVSDLELANQNP